jgi:hypothetical protein
VTSYTRGFSKVHDVQQRRGAPFEPGFGQGLSVELQMVRIGADGVDEPVTIKAQPVDHQPLV